MKPQHQPTTFKISLTSSLPIEVNACECLEELLFLGRAGDRDAVVKALHVLYWQSGIGVEEAEYRSGFVADHWSGTARPLSVADYSPAYA